MSHLIEKKMIRGTEEELKKIKVDGLNDCPNDLKL